MAVRTTAVLKSQFLGRDPVDHNTDVVDTLSALLSGLKFITVDGRNAAGAITATGAAVGDTVVGVAGLTAGALGAADASFEGTITVLNQIQQSSASNLSANDYLVVLASLA
jgi:hypothetical protein